MLRTATFVAVLSLGLLACAGRAPEPSAPPTVTATPTPTAPPPPSAPQLSPDEILQQRLVSVAKNLDSTLASREPEPEFGIIGLGTGKLSGSRLGSGAGTTHSPKLRFNALSASGRLPPEVIQRIVRQNFGRFRLCYEKALQQKKGLTAKVVTRFTIETDGSISGIKSTGDPATASNLARCVETAFKALAFPQPENGVVKVTLPITFVPDDSATPEPESPPPPPPPPPAPEEDATEPAPPEGPWPIVALEADSVRVDGTEVASVKPLRGLGRLQKVDGLFDALKAARERWKEQHPHSRFPGVAGLRVEPKESMLVVKSLFQTAAFAGFPNLSLQSAAEPSRIVELAAIVPGPPREGLFAPMREPSLVLHLRFAKDGVTLTWKRGATVESEDRAEGADLGAAVCASWKAHGSHRDPADPLLDHLVVHGDNDKPFGALVELNKALASCSRARRDQSGAEQRVVPLWISLSVN